MKKYYLTFLDYNKTFRIAEPFGYDSFSITMEEKQNGFSTDMKIFAENSELEFTDSCFEKCEQFEDIDGTIYENLTHCLKRIIDAYNEYGPDAQIIFSEYIDGILHIQCGLDLESVDTDLCTYFKCGCSEIGKKYNFKINEDSVVIDLYSDKDLFGNTIEKLEPVKILAISNSIQTKSKWIKTDIYYSGAPNGITNKFPAGTFRYFNFAKNPILYGISDSLVPSPFDDTNNYQDTYNGLMKIVDCKTTKNNVKLVFTQDITYVHKHNGRSGYINRTSLELKVRVSYGVTASESTVYTIYSIENTTTNTITTVLPTEIEFTLPIPLREGEFLTYWWEYSWTESTIALTTDYSAIDNYSHLIVNDCNLEISANETTINTITNGLLWIDTLKKSSEIISGLPVDAPIIENEYRKIAILNGAGIRNISGIPFNVKTKDLFETCLMIGLDYKVTEEDVKIASYSDFHSDKVIRTFENTNDTLTFNTNKNYRIKTLEYKFRNIEQDKDEINTLDAVHTEQHRLMPNLKTKNTKLVDVSIIVDSYKIETLKRQGLGTDYETSSLKDDDTLIALSITELEQNHYETYTGKFYISTTENGIKIVSKNFKWTILGMAVTGEFQILQGSNSGNYTILNIEDTVLTLVNNGTNINVSKDEIITIRYKIYGVQYKSRTNEGFSYINGIIAPDRYSNLILSIRRNLKNWIPYIASCVSNMVGKIIKVNYVKSNRNLVTRLDNETELLADTADINVNDILELRKVTNRTFECEVYLNDGDNINQIFNELNTKNSDNTIGGCLQFKTKCGGYIKGYPIKIEYVNKLNKLEGVYKEKYENDSFYIDSQDRINYSRFIMNGIYVTLFDNNDIEIFNSKRFTKIKINGISYTDIDTFIDKLHEYFS